MPREARPWAQGVERRHFAHVTDLWRTVTPRGPKWSEPFADTVCIWHISLASFPFRSGLTNYLPAQELNQQLLLAFPCPFDSCNWAASIQGSGGLAEWQLNDDLDDK